MQAKLSETEDRSAGWDAAYSQNPFSFSGTFQETITL